MASKVHRPLMVLAGAAALIAFPSVAGATEIYGGCPGCQEVTTTAPPTTTVTSVPPSSTPVTTAPATTAPETETDDGAPSEEVQGELVVNDDDEGSEEVRGQTLPVTGGDLATMGLVAVSLGAVGTGLVVIDRRRRSTADR